MDTFLNSNRLFVAFFCLSLFLHYIVFAVAPVEKLLKAGMPLLYDDSVKEQNSATIEFELESPPEVSRAEEKAPLQEKRLSFVDTSDSPLDEKPQGDTDKIGVKATVARDTYEGEEKDNNQPYLEGNSTGLFLSKGELLFDDTAFKGSEGQNEPQMSQESAVMSQGSENRSQEFGLETQDSRLETQVKLEASEIKTIEKPLEIEDEGEVVPLVTPPQEHKMNQGSVVSSPAPMGAQESGLKTQDARLMTQELSGKKINKVAKKGSPVIYEDTISNAQLTGEASFSVQRHEYAEYFQHIRDRIGLYWFLSYGYDQSIKLETANRLPVIIEFKILPSGRTDGVEIIDEAGNHLLAARIQASIQTTRLNKFPLYIKEDFIAVRFNFYFF